MPRRNSKKPRKKTIKKTSNKDTQNIFCPEDLDKIEIINKEIDLIEEDIVHLKNSISEEDYWDRVEELYFLKLNQIKVEDNNEKEN